MGCVAPVEPQHPWTPRFSGAAHHARDSRQHETPEGALRHIRPRAFLVAHPVPKQKNLAVSFVEHKHPKRDLRNRQIRSGISVCGSPLHFTVHSDHERRSGIL